MTTQKQREQAQRWKQKNKATLKEKNKQYYKDNQPQCDAATKKWFDEHKEHAYKTGKRLRGKKPIKYKLHFVRASAKHRGIEFTITEKDIVANTHCPYLGIPLDGRDRDHQLTFDRIDNNKGYVPGNVIVCSGRANRLKSDASIRELETLTLSLRLLLNERGGHGHHQISNG